MSKGEITAAVAHDRMFLENMGHITFNHKEGAETGRTRGGVFFAELDEKRNHLGRTLISKVMPGQLIYSSHGY